MALMIVGFGIKDSISAIAVLQYEEIQQYDGNVILNEDASEEERALFLEECRMRRRTWKNLLRKAQIPAFPLLGHKWSGYHM